MTPEQIGRLTPYQVRHVYFRKEEENPTDLPWFMQTSSPNSQGTPIDKEKELFWKVNREWRNIPEEKVQELWEKNPGLQNPQKG